MFFGAVMMMTLAIIRINSIPNPMLDQQPIKPLLSSLDIQSNKVTKETKGYDPKKNNHIKPEGFKGWKYSKENPTYKPVKTVAEQEASIKAREEALQVEWDDIKKHTLHDMPLSSREKSGSIQKIKVELEIPESIQRSETGLEPLVLKGKTFDQVINIRRQLTNAVCDIYDSLFRWKSPVTDPSIQNLKILELKERLVFIERYNLAVWDYMPENHALKTVGGYLAKLKRRVSARDIIYKDLGARETLTILAKGGAVLAGAFALANIYELSHE